MIEFVNCIDYKKLKGCPRQRRINALRRDLMKVMLEMNENLVLDYRVVGRERRSKLVLVEKRHNGLKYLKIFFYLTT